MQSELEEKIRKHLAEASDKDIRPERITPEMSLREDLDFNSLSAVELVMQLEQEFGVEVSDEELETLQTVGDVFSLVDKKLRDQTKEAS